MTEKSYYWDGLVTGDATLSPITELVYHEQWYKMFSRYNHGGVIEGYLNELAVVGTSGGVQIATGAALVDGWFYENTTTVTKTLDTPSTNPRIDVVVARMDISTQTVRITVIEGTEAASPSAPAITQVHGVVWDIKLAEVNITTAGVITITNSRKYCVSPLAELGTWVKIEEIEISSGLQKNMEFENIPQVYKDLKIVLQAISVSTSVLEIILNDDENTNYAQQILYINNAGNITAIADNNAGNLTAFVLTDGTLTSLDAPIASFVINNYTNPYFYKNGFSEIQVNVSINSERLLYRHGIWLNTDAVTKITLSSTVSIADLLNGSVATLYGRGFSGY